MLLTPQQAARELGVSTRHLRRMAIPFVNVGTRERVIRRYDPGGARVVQGGEHMSVYRRIRGGVREAEYSYDFRLGGRRFLGRTGETDRRRAEAAEKRIRNEVMQDLKAARSETLTFVKASARYWNEVGRHHRNSVDTKRSLAWLLDEIGMTTPVSSIGNALVASLVAKRRADGVSPATVNRQVIEPLRGMLRRASDLWGADVRRIDWKRHALPEPQERVREMTDAEEAAFFAACRDDYAPLYRFALLSGCRMAECIDLEWRAIDWRARTIRVTGKGARTRLVPLTDAMVTLLRRLPRAHARVFTYEKRRAGDGARGERRPIRYESLKSDFARTIARAGIEDFRFHDFRHTAATRLLRATGNLRLVQKLLGHSDIATTTRYAHATGDDLLSAMNRAESASAAARTPAETPAMRDSASDK